jgi:streptogramin lyase
MQDSNSVTWSNFLVLSILFLLVTSFSISSSFLFYPRVANAQPITLKDMVTYAKQSNFIKEFKIPLTERGLKGITTDTLGNAWFYHSSFNSSTILKLEPTTMKFTRYSVPGKTIVDNALINLAGGQLVFDNDNNVVWFTDARTNTIGKLDVKSGDIQLVSIPTPKAGPMGIVLSPDGKSIWFAEITGNKIANLDIHSNRIIEYPVIGSASSSNNGILNNQDNGPTFLTFDSKGVLWVTLSYSSTVLRVEPWTLIPNSSTMGMSPFTLVKSETFSPFGIAVVDYKGGTQQRMYVSDHGSSRVISSDVGPNLLLQSYLSYWTSPSQVYPTTLPGQIVADKLGKAIYFPEHGGNRIAKINVDSGQMTEYDIPTGPLSTALFTAISGDGKKLWFTEWASNKIAYLDTTIPLPLTIQIPGYYNINNTNNNPNTQLVLKRNEPKILDVVLRTDDNNKTVIEGNSPSTSRSLLLNEIGISFVGMSESGIVGINYTAQPQRFDMEKNSTANSQIALQVGNDDNNTPPIRPGQYTIMVRATALENKNNNSVVSLLYPVQIMLDVPAPPTNQMRPQQTYPNGISNNYQVPVNGFFDYTSLGGILRIFPLLVAIGLIAYIVYRRIERSRKTTQQHRQQEK